MVTQVTRPTWPVPITPTFIASSPLSRPFCDRRDDRRVVLVRRQIRALRQIGPSGARRGGNPAGPGELGLDPHVGPAQALLERCLRLPAEHSAQPGVVAVATSYALRLRQVVVL